MSRLITFYSYKGGVGRTFALANTAVLLAQSGHRVLAIDWDLEAPGLHRYFDGRIDVANSGGLIHLLMSAAVDKTTEWQQFVSQVSLKASGHLDLLCSGDHCEDYAQAVRSFSWNDFIHKHKRGQALEDWRREWKATYDYVLIDSRTGITDSGGVCTVVLPDILVLVFGANRQSFDRGMDVVAGVQSERLAFGLPRPPLAILPLPGRFDGRDEVEDAAKWLDRFAERCKSLYDVWLPAEFSAREMLEVTKIPYVAKFSFGEPLPILTHGVTDRAPLPCRV